MAKHRVPVVRREPTEADLADESGYVIDVGGQHAPAQRNFDHHQFPREFPPVCALSLVLQHLGLYEEAKRCCDWLETAEWFDARGPRATAEWLGVEREALGRLNSPLDVTLLRRFAACEQLEPGEPLYEVLAMVGEDLLGYVEGMRDRVAALREQAEFWSIAPEEGDPFEVLFVPRSEPLPEEPGAGVGRFVEQAGKLEAVAGTVYADRRGAGYALSRFNDDERLEFTRIAQEPDVHFAHARGFVAKTSATDPGRLRDLLAQSWRGR